MRKLFLFTLGISLICCGQNRDFLSVHPICPKQHTYSIEEALDNLDSFQSLLNEDGCLTKGVKRKSIANISLYPSISTTKADGADSIQPLAYIINFENGEGFAVLGANEDRPAIIAYVENGSINPVTLQLQSTTQIDTNSFFSTFGVSFSSYVNFDWWCEEDEDYYSADEFEDMIVPHIIGNGINNPPDPGESNGGGGGGLPNIAPMLI